ncbi:hypothetical protein [Marinilabilia sp.]
MNKTFNFIFGTVGTAGTMEVVEVFPSGPEEINVLIIIVVKALISLLGGVITTRLANVAKEKRAKRKAARQQLNKVKSIKKH